MTRMRMHCRPAWDVCVGCYQDTARDCYLRSAGGGNDGDERWGDGDDEQNKVTTSRGDTR
jgi:hypothetical protein